MEDYPGSLAQGAVLFSDSADWEAHAGPLDLTMCRPTYVPNHVRMATVRNASLARSSQPRISQLRLHRRIARIHGALPPLSDD